MTHEPCVDYVSLIVRAAEGDAGALERARLDSHVATCAACRESLAVQRDVRSILRTRPSVQPSTHFHTRVMSSLETPVRWFERWDFRRGTWWLAPVAAAMIVAIFGVTRWSGAATTDTTAETTSETAGTLPVSSALWSDAVTDTSLLSLMLHASPDDMLADHLIDRIKDPQP